MVIVGILITVLMLGVFGAMGFAVYKQLQKTDPNRADSSAIGTIDCAQDFLPFEDIQDNMICLGGHKYRAVIEASSTNYNLKTDREKEIIELSFQRFINSLTFPITFFIQTKVLDNSKMLNQLENELAETVDKYPQMKEYANNYLKEMQNLNNFIGNNKQKKKYIIIPYEEATGLGNLNDNEKYEYSLNELKQRALLIVDGLSSIGVKASILNTEDLMDLIYSSYYKDNASQSENIVNKEFLELITHSKKNQMEDLIDDARMDWILYEAQMRIKNELVSKNLPDYVQEDFNSTIKKLDELRDTVGGYYKNESTASQDFNFKKRRD